MPVEPELALEPHVDEPRLLELSAECPGFDQAGMHAMAAAAMAAAAASLDRLAVVSKPDAAAEPLRHWLQSGDVVLLKASRGVALERLLPLLPSV